jgi:hypothetical protein
MGKRSLEEMMTKESENKTSGEPMVRKSCPVQEKKRRKARLTDGFYTNHWVSRTRTHTHTHNRTLINQRQQ